MPQAGYNIAPNYFNQYGPTLSTGRNQGGSYPIQQPEGGYVTDLYVRACAYAAGTNSGYICLWHYVDVSSAPLAVSVAFNFPVIPAASIASNGSNIPVSTVHLSTPLFFQRGDYLIAGVWLPSSTNWAFAGHDDGTNTHPEKSTAGPGDFGGANYIGVNEVAYWDYTPQGSGVNTWTGAGYIKHPANTWSGAGWVRHPVKTWTGAGWATR